MPDSSSTPSGQPIRFRPTWSTPHNVQLKPADQYPTCSSGSPHANDISKHRPLGQTGWDGGRKAGTYGIPVAYENHPDDVVEPTIRDDTKARGVSNLEQWRCTQDDVEAKGGVDAILRDPKSILTVRDAKKAIPDFKLLDPRHHAFARFVLPVSEAAIKSQEWPGKEHPEDKDKEKGEGDKDDSDDKQGSDNQKESEKKQDPNGKGEGDQDDNNAHNQGQGHDKEIEALDKLVDEVRTFRQLRNDLGKVSGPLKLLDGDALEQLESRISIDDQSTPDSWIPRSQHLLRLTGKHPLNAEPNLSALYNAGMITPTKLHYVRSHGPVPALDWNNHTLEVTVYTDYDRDRKGEALGLKLGVDKDSEPTVTRVWTMDEIADGSFTVKEFPVTIACDGNRRKEVNMIKRSAGYNWSAAGVSTCLWRGIFLRDVLLATGLRSDPEEYEEWFLHLEGADKCSEGTYATSIPLTHIMEPVNDVMLVFGQNGRVLHPDHGYPLRIIIPGFVGGRQVKWLKKVWIAKEANTSHYHIWDNKVVPSEIDSKDHPLANAYFHHEDSACYEQILQSVICKPAHDERLPLPTGEGGLDEMYTVQGYAYDGAGTKVQRVELSLDKGDSWKYCWRRFIDKPLRHGSKYWTWVFWSCDVRIGDLINAEEVIVRAFDAKKNTQPEHLTWNYMGMMNNSWYRVKPSLSTDPKTKKPVVHFRHPVAPGQDKGGWMKPNLEDELTSQSGGTGQEFSLEDVSKHNTKDDAWLILDGKVYDVTSVLSWHPGGAQAIMTYAGKATVDATNQYKGIHDNYANSKRDECFIGVLSKEGQKAMEKDAKRAAEELAKVKEERKDYALQPDYFTAAKLVKRKELNIDTRLYTFELPKRDDGSHGLLALPIGQHVQIAIHFEDQAVMRSYTPVRPVLPNEEDGTFDLLVKTYMPSDGGPFPPGGTASNYLDVMQEGEEIDILGPNGGIIYKGRGEFEIEGKTHHFKNVNLVAGGSGLTPHWQFIHAVLSDKDDKTQISLIDSNKTYEDILLREELQKYADEESDRFKLWHCISKEPKDVEWKYTIGHLDKKLMNDHFFPVEDDSVATLLCGPPGLIEKAAVPALKELGFEEGKSLFGY